MPFIYFHIIRRECQAPLFRVLSSSWDIQFFQFFLFDLGQVLAMFNTYQQALCFRNSAGICCYASVFAIDSLANELASSSN